MAEPATKVSAPASATRRMLSTLMPPSTSRRMSRPEASMTLRTFSHLRSVLSMKLWPPKPGFTLISSTTSTLSMTHSSTSMGEAGLNTRPAWMPSALMSCSVRSTWVEGDDVGAGLGEGRGQGVNGLHHQVHVDGHLRAIGFDAVLAQGLADHRPEGQVGHVMVVHHVEVDPVRAGVDHVAHLFAQAGEVGREDAGGDAEGAWVGRHGRAVPGGAAGHGWAPKPPF